MKMEILLEPTSNKLLVGDLCDSTRIKLVSTGKKRCYERSHKGVKASANSDIVYFFTSAQDGDPLQDDVRLCLADDLKKAQDHNQRQVNDESKDHYPKPIENQAPLVVTMDDNPTMAQLLEKGATTVGYEDAIVVPEITADNFELKQDHFYDEVPERPEYVGKAYAFPIFPRGCCPDLA
ncbi:hypothetical protein Tco_0932044 [Tanacetum coccineum]